MLASLCIRDLAVVESLDLEFSPGFTVLTGETGAGKSILLTALGLALGERADTMLIRPGSNRAEVTLAFDLSDARDARSWLEEQELGDGETCMLRRTIGRDGRSKSFINDRPVTAQALQELSSRLVEIHGQHAHLVLLNPAEQMRLLDDSAGNQKLRAEVGAAYASWKSIDAELQRLRHDGAARSAREELLRYQLEELTRFEIADLDYERLIEEHTRCANAGKIATLGQQQMDLLYDDEHHSISRLLAQALAGIRELGHLAPEFSELTELLDGAQIQVKEAASSLRRSLDHLEADPLKLEQIEERLADVHRLARKHQVPPAQLREKLEELAGEVGGLAQDNEKIVELEQSLDTEWARYRDAANRISARRMEAATGLGDRVTAVIRELGMPHGRFQVASRAEADEHPGPLGHDRVEFSVASNPGLPPRPIGKVASGGELSRISLAIQVSAMDYKATPSLIFDEVDTGIGGGVAEIVGQKLRLLASDRQVFCVTHLPQVAALGHNHLVVEKTTQGDSTTTSVRALSPEERTSEIARMLGGVRITEQTLRHAAEMLEGGAV
ncbi:MAG: DNA repair protein RecN [Methylotetracoccus sp.]